MKNSQAQTQAFTRTELIIVVAMLGLVGLLFVRAQDDPAPREKQQRLECMKNLKMMNLAFRMWANDNSGSFPMKVPAAKGGAKEAIDTGETFRHFAVLSNYLQEVKYLSCPSDERAGANSFEATRNTPDSSLKENPKVRVDSFDTLRNTNLSYFVGLEADETKPQMLLSGDRNLTNGLPLKNGVMTLIPGAPEGWTAALHRENGNLALADGSVQQVTMAGLRRQIQAQELSTPGPKRLQLPE